MKLYPDSTTINRLCLGSILLGSGGGGNPQILKPAIERLFTGSLRSIHLVPYTDIPDHCTVAAVGMMGSPELLEESLPDGTEGAAVVQALERSLQRRIDYLIPLEAAGVNSVYALLVSARTGLPIIDGDGMGRAFPELQMTTFHIYGQKGTPFALVGSSGETIVFDDKDNFMLELNTRKALMKFGGVGYFAGFAMSGHEAKEALIPGTLSFLLELGTNLETSNYEKCLLQLADVTKNSIYGTAIELFVGTVGEIGHIDTLKLGTLTLNGIKQYSNSSFNVLMQNENVIAYKNHEVVGMVPDLICFLEYSSGLPINNNEAAKDMVLSVIGIPAPNMLRTKKGLSVVGPQSFGYKMEYIPLEQLHSEYYF